MRSFHLQSGEEITAALPEAEVVALLASGELTPDQPCRLAEEDVWRTVADFFPSGSGLKVRTAKPPASEAEQISDANRIDDATRRRLLAYGLADAVNIDGFTQSQAVKAIVRKEEETRSVWHAHRRVQVGDFLSLLEFFSSFQELMEVKDSFPNGITYDVLESALRPVDSPGGTLFDLLNFALNVIFDLQHQGPML